MADWKDFKKDAESSRIIDGLDEKALDTSDLFANKLAGVSRRDFHRIAGLFGLSSTLFAAQSMGGLFSAEALAQTANTKFNKRFGKKAKHVLRLGTIFNERQHNVQRAGVWEFVRDLEERTDGEIRVEMQHSNSICAETKCQQMAMQGILDIATTSTQNGAAVAPWLNALDWPFMWQSRGQIYNFFFAPESEKLFRSIYRKQHGMEFLFTLAELRQLFMGLKWKDRPPVTEVGQLAGTKIRATNTQLGRIALKLMGTNPVPVAWVETLDAMKSGLVDGMETWPTAATAFNMTPVISKYVGVNFIPGTGHCAMRSQTFDKLGPELQEMVRESAHLAQINTMLSNEAGLLSITGATTNPPKGTILGDNNVEMNFLSNEAVAEAEAMASPDKPEYAIWHEKLNEMGGFDVYKEIKAVARSYPADARTIDVEARRYWKT